MNQLSEKRFIVESVMKITDCNEDKSRIVKVITDKEELYSYDDLYEISDLLNEQQATIEEQNKEIKELEEKIQRIYVNVCSAMSEVIDDATR